MNSTRPILRALWFSTALSLIASLQPAHAATFTYDLTFVDSQGNPVGTGAFSYDSEKVVVVRTPNPYSSAYVAGKDDPLRPDYIPPSSGLWQVAQYPNPLTSFIARLPGRNWSLEDLFLSWWDPDAAAIASSFGCSRSGCGISAQWFGGSIAGFAPGQFGMFAQTSLEQGTYTGSFISAVIPSSPDSFTSGTWFATARSAEAVPEPTTVFGAIAFGTSCLLYKAKRKSNK